MSTKNYSVIDMSAQKIINVADPGSAQDVATQNYVVTTYARITENINTQATAGASQTLSAPGTNSINFLTLTSATCTLTFPTATAGMSFMLYALQDGTGGRLITWPSTSILIWPGGANPILTTTLSKADLFGFLCIDGTHWVGSISGQNI